MTKRHRITKAELDRVADLLVRRGCQIASVEIALDGVVRFTTTAGKDLTTDDEDASLDRENADFIARGNGQSQRRI